MKILMLTPYLPYPDSSGGQIRTQNLLKHLKRKHDITLISLIKDPQEKQYIPILEKKFCKKVKVFQRSRKPFTLKNILKTGFSLDPFLVVRNFSPEAQKGIAYELANNNYDLIHVETFYAMPHIPNTKIPVVLVDQTIEFKVYQHYVKETSPLFLRPLMNIDVLKLKASEQYYWRKANKVIAVSDKDREDMLRLEPNLDTDIVPNGVNLDFFKKKTSWETKQPTILFVGNFFWLQNTEAAQTLINQILPLVKREIPNAKVWIVGQHQPDSLKSLASDSVVIRDIAEDDTQSIVDAYHDADVFCTPLKGPGGTRLKNLAAMASQLPIVSSSVGMAGLGITSGQHALVEDKTNKMAQAIVRVIKDPKLAAQLAQSSRQYVEQQFSYEVIANKLSQIYQQVAQKNKHD